MVNPDSQQSVKISVRPSRLRCERRDLRAASRVGRGLVATPAKPQAPSKRVKRRSACCAAQAVAVSSMAPTAKGSLGARCAGHRSGSQTCVVALSTGGGAQPEASSAVVGGRSAGRNRGWRHGGRVGVSSVCDSRKARLDRRCARRRGRAAEAAEGEPVSPQAPDQGRRQPARSVQQAVAQGGAADFIAVCKLSPERHGKTETGLGGDAAVKIET